MTARVRVTLIAAAVVACAMGVGYGGYRLGTGSKGAEALEASSFTEGAAPEVRVQVSQIGEGSLDRPIIAFGTVIVPATEQRVLSVPFESQVVSVTVAAGEETEVGQPLIAITPTAATRLTLQEAKSALESTQRDLKMVQGRYDQNFATNTDLNAAKNAAEVAQTRFQSLSQAGAEGAFEVKATTRGIVARVDVQPGQVVPVSGSLVELGSRDRFEAKLGVEPTDAESLQPDMRVTLRAIQSDREVIGKIRLVSREVDATTRLRNVFVALPPGSSFPLNSALVGALTQSGGKGLLVPRDALVPGESGAFSIFTVNNGKATRHSVKVAAENNRAARITGEGVKPGDVVVVVGAEQLDDAMAVISGPATASEAAQTDTPSPTSQPAEASGSTLLGRGEP